ncbi:MAG: transglutaminase domain-containing protein [Kofleriaceae bacterium]
MEPPAPPAARRWPALGVLVGAVALGAAAVAQPAASGRPVLHEDLPGPATADPASPAIGPVAADQNPTALASGDKILPRPSEQARSSDEPIYGRDGMASDRATEWRPDLDTGTDGTLRYAAVFNPDVLPFKRMTALDAVRADYTMEVARRAQVDLPVGGELRADRDAFWGSLVLELAPGVDVPIPSVAPDMRVLSYETTPRTRLVFSKDGADNFFVRGDDAGARGQVRLVFLADADAGYFAPALPTERLTPARVRVMAPAELRVTVPPPVLAQATRTLDQLAVDERTELGVALNRLIGFFRAFEAKAPPPSTGDLYRDLCDHQAGVCRHRSFAFMVTANALGIPTRYITNEAHAFVELWLSRRGWQRIDPAAPRSGSRSPTPRARPCTGRAPRIRSPSRRSTATTTRPSTATSAASPPTSSRTSARRSIKRPRAARRRRRARPPRRDRRRQ